MHVMFLYIWHVLGYLTILMAKLKMNPSEIHSTLIIVRFQSRDHWEVIQLLKLMQLNMKQSLTLLHYHKSLMFSSD